MMRSSCVTPSQPDGGCGSAVFTLNLCSDGDSASKLTKIDLDHISAHPLCWISFSFPFGVDVLGAVRSRCDGF